MRETPIQVAYPSVGNPHLRIVLGACRFTARPGRGEKWVAGTYNDPTDRRPLRIIEEEASVTITEADPHSKGFRPSSEVYPATKSS